MGNNSLGKTSCVKALRIKRTRLLIFWISGSALLGGFAFYLNWKLGAVWSVFAVLGFVVMEKMLLQAQGVC